MLDHLIREGRLFLHEIEKQYVETLPPEDRIPVDELNGWYAGVRRALEQCFGIDSAEVKLWKDGREKIEAECWTQVGRPGLRDGHFVQKHLTGSLGLLRQIKLLALANSKTPLRTATPPHEASPNPPALDQTEGRSEQAERRPSGSVMVGGPELALWLEEQMESRGHMTVNRLHVLSGLDRKTIKKMLNGVTVRARHLRRLAEGLSREGPEVEVLESPVD